MIHFLLKGHHQARISKKKGKLCAVLVYYAASCGNYHTTPRNIREERRSHQGRGGSLKSRLKRKADTVNCHFCEKDLFSLNFIYYNYTVVLKISLT